MIILSAGPYVPCGKDNGAGDSIMDAKADNTRLDVRLELSDRDRDAFLATMGNPPKPNARLRRAAKRHHTQVEQTAR
jgi:uncharacterized protein (DUF1778 family)